MFESNIPPAFPPRGTPVCVHATMSKLPNGTFTRLKIERILTLEEVRQQAIKQLTITLDARASATTKDHQQALQNLKSTVFQHGGPTKLKLEVVYPGATVALDAESGIELTDRLMRQLKTLELSSRYN